MLSYIQHIADSIIQLITNHPESAQWIIFSLAFIESLAILGSIFPGTLLLTPIGIILGSGALPFEFTVMNIFIAAFLGDFLSYIIGYYFHKDIESSQWIKSQQKTFDWFKYFIQKHGTLSLVIGRFAGPLRSSIPLFAGLLGMRPLRFVFGIIPSICLWMIAYFGPGYLIGRPDVSHYLATTLSVMLHKNIYIFIGVLGLFILSYVPIFTHGAYNKIWSIVLRCTGLLSILIMFVVNGYLVHLHNTMLYTMHQIMPDNIALCISYISDKMTVFPVLLAFIILSMLRMQRFTLPYPSYFCTIALCSLMVPSIKYLTKIQRPIPTIYAQDYSFPSGHVTLITALGILAIVFARTSRNKIIITMLWCVILAMVALSRMSLASHWLGDIVGGVILGCIIFTFSLAVHLWSKSDEHIGLQEGFLIIISILCIGILRFLGHTA